MKYIILLLLTSCAGVSPKLNIKKEQRAPSSEDKNCNDLVKLILVNINTEAEPKNVSVGNFETLSIDLNRVIDESLSFREKLAKGLWPEAPKGMTREGRVSFRKLLSQVDPQSIVGRKKMLIKLFNEGSGINNINLGSSQDEFVQELIMYIETQGKLLEKEKLNHFLGQFEQVLKNNNVVLLTDSEKNILSSWEKNSSDNALKLYKKLTLLIQDQHESKETKKMLREILTSVMPHSSTGKSKLLDLLFEKNDEFINGVNLNLNPDMFSIALVFEQMSSAGYLAYKARRDHFLLTLELVLKKEISLEFSAKEITEKKAIQLKKLLDLRSQIENGQNVKKQTRELLANEFRGTDEEKFKIIRKVLGEESPLIGELPFGTYPREFTSKLIDGIQMQDDDTSLLKLINFFIDKNKH